MATADFTTQPPMRRGFVVDDKGIIILNIYIVICLPAKPNPNTSTLLAQNIYATPSNPFQPAALLVLHRSIQHLHPLLVSALTTEVLRRKKKL